MDTILFVGNRVDGYFAEELAASRGSVYHQIDIKSSDIRKTTNDILAYIHSQKNLSVDFIIYDADRYINEAAEIAAEIRGLVRTIEAKPIIYMPSFLPESELVRALYAHDIHQFIFGGSSYELKEQLERNMTGFFDANERKELAEIRRLQEEEASRILQFHTIGIAGAQNRVGTTTQALQIVKYLQHMGHRACYVEMNSIRYFDMSGKDGSDRQVSFTEKYRLWTEGSSETKVSFNGIDLFFGPEGISESMKQGYDYYVYDYGSVTDRDFDRTAFLKDDIQIFTGGAKPSEFDYLLRMLDIPVFLDACLLLSFVPEKEEESILRLLHEYRIKRGNNRNRPIMFCDYCPDPFVFSSPEKYMKVIPMEMTEARQQELLGSRRKSRGLFRKKEKKDGAL